MFYLKLGLANLKPADLVSKSSTIEQNMDGNVNFPSPEPALADVTAKRVELDTLISKASVGDRVAIADRNVAYNELAAMLRKLAKYVSLTADGNEGIILSSGFGVRKQSEPQPQVTRPMDFNVQRAQRQGEVILSWKTVQGGMSYLVDMTTTDPSLPTTVWTQIAVTTRGKHKAENLTAGTYYWFRVSAVGRKNVSAYSNVELIMAA